MSLPEYLKNYNGNGHTLSSDHDDIDFTDVTPAPRLDPDAWKKEHRMTTGWHAREPRFVHSLKWHDSEGVEHLHVVRSDDLDEVLREIRTVKQFIKAAKAHAAEQAVAVTATTAEDQQKTAAADKSAADTPPKGWCEVHHTWMTRHTKGDSA
jgi:hypothetical protein